MGKDSFRISLAMYHTIAITITFVRYRINSKLEF